MASNLPVTAEHPTQWRFHHTYLKRVHPDMIPNCTGFLNTLHNDLMIYKVNQLKVLLKRLNLTYKGRKHFMCTLLAAKMKKMFLEGRKTLKDIITKFLEEINPKHTLFPCPIHQKLVVKTDTRLVCKQFSGLENGMRLNRSIVGPICPEHDRFVKVYSLKLDKLKLEESEKSCIILYDAETNLAVNAISYGLVLFIQLGGDFRQVVGSNQQIQFKPNTNSTLYLHVFTFGEAKGIAFDIVVCATQTIEEKIREIPYDTRTIQKTRLNNEIEALDAEFSLICPISRLRMKTAGKGVQCRHEQCFDLETFMRSDMQTCPICNNMIKSYHDLVKSSLLFNVLLEAPDDAVKVSISPTGQISFPKRADREIIDLTKMDYVFGTYYSLMEVKKEPEDPKPVPKVDPTRTPKRRFQGNAARKCVPLNVQRIDWQRSLDTRMFINDFIRPLNPSLININRATEYEVIDVDEPETTSSDQEIECIVID